MNLFFAFLIVLVAAAMCFGLLSLFGVAEKIAGPLASALFGAITYVHQAIEKQRATTSATASAQGVVTLRGYFFSPVLMFVYASLTLYAMMVLIYAYGRYSGALLSDIIDSIDRNEVTDLMLPLLIATSVTKVAVAYVVGRWVGSRARRFSEVVLLCSIAGASILVMAVYSIGGGSSLFFQDPLGPKVLLLGFADNFGSMTVPGLIGVWRGKRLRLTRYLGYLLSRLPMDTRFAIVNMVYDEVNRLTAGAMKEQGPVNL
jgi:hypothetical protein